MEVNALPQSQTSEANNAGSFNLQNILLLLSALCIAGWFYVSGTRNTAEEVPAQSASLASIGDNRPGAVNEAITGKSTQTVSQLVNDALAFKALLTTSQQTTLQQNYTASLARKWSNLPCGSNCRNGIQFGTLTSAQLAAAHQVIRDALGTADDDGYAEFYQMNLAEAYLHANGGGNGYDSTLRWIAFLNTPSTTGAWMLQFGGHHYAANIAFNNGHVIGATPFFMGVEPKSFSWNATAYAPLNDERDALADMLASLSSSQLSTAKLSTTFSDCTMVPGETNGGNGNFPSTKLGVACNTFSAAQKDLVLAAIQHYVGDMDSATAAAVMQVYTDEIDGTYVAYTGNGTSGNAASFLVSNSNYVRIDGPTVWVEFSCQNGVVISGQIHYHTVWRDHSHDYGLDLTGPAIDVTSSTGVAQPERTIPLTVFPNPATGTISINLPVTAKDATVTVINSATGQAVSQTQHLNGATIDYDISRLPKGAYILKVREAGAVYIGKVSRQ
ncbi:MAG: DUF3500 domain-containing protein [Saprospiraceae bacterium]